MLTEVTLYEYLKNRESTWLERGMRTGAVLKVRYLEHEYIFDGKVLVTNNKRKRSVTLRTEAEDNRKYVVVSSAQWEQVELIEKI